MSHTFSETGHRRPAESPGKHGGLYGKRGCSVVSGTQPQDPSGEVSPEGPALVGGCTHVSSRWTASGAAALPSLGTRPRCVLSAVVRG